MPRDPPARTVAAISDFLLTKKPVSTPQARVTRLGEFSPIGRLLNWAFFNMYNIFVSHFGLLFSQKNSCEPSSFDKIRVGLHFGRLFSEKHPVTLPPATHPAKLH
jgi:hypothetical protein